MSFNIYLEDDRKSVHKVKNITDFTLVKSLDSPTAAVKISYLTGKDMGRILYVTAEKSGETLFRGCVDRCVCNYRYNLRKHTLEARDAGAMLLDQEALPAKYKNADFKEIYSKYIRPNSNINNGVTEKGHLSEFAVSKGQSVWSVVRNFCMEAYKAEPYIYKGRVCIKSPTKTVAIKNHILSLSEEYKPCQKIGKVFIRDNLGTYKGCVLNPFDSECKRNKYYIPTSEWEHARESAESIIKSSMRKSENVKIELDGALNIEPGDTLEFCANGREYTNLTAFEVCIKGSKDITTKITAVRSCYL